MTRIILFGSFVVDISLIAMLCLSFLILGHRYVGARIAVGLIVLAYLIFVGYFIHKQRVRIGAWMLVSLYAIIGLSILHNWGINAPVGILILGFVIVLTGVMLGAKHIITVTFGIILALIILQYLNIIGVSQPDRSTLDNNSTYGDVASYAVIFCIFALIAWLSGSRMEDTLERVLAAELELQNERDVLAIRVEEQTKKLRDAQQKELKQLYKFAELGQLTTIILHELANYLSVLTLDIDDLKERHENSIAISHAKESIFYIDTIIDQVRNQIKDSDNAHKFDALLTTKDSMEQLRKKLVNSDIKLFVEDKSKSDYTIYGDPLRLFQAITILVTNAAQANTAKQTEISVEVSSTKSKILISVKDFGKGIAEHTRKTLFEPQKSTKTAGLGIGLYITKQIVETHFKGKIWLSPSLEYTQFNIEVPKARYSRNAHTSPSPHKSAASNPVP
jgi:signal transduction histidine kinase